MLFLVLFLVHFYVFLRAFSGAVFRCFLSCFFWCLLVILLVVFFVLFRVLFPLYSGAFSVHFFVLVPFLFYICFPLVVFLFFAVLFLVVFGCFFRAFFRVFFLCFFCALYRAFFRAFFRSFSCSLSCFFFRALGGTQDKQPQYFAFWPVLFLVLFLVVTASEGRVYTTFMLGKKRRCSSLKFDKVERPVDFMVSGPPCPPWAGNGCKQGTDDTRSHVFLAVVKLAIALIKCGELKAIILENVRGICHKQKGHNTSFMGILLEFLRKEVAEFHWEVCQLQASDYLLPQQRCRVFLRGLRASIGQVPDPLPAFGHQELANILNPKLPSVDWKSLTPTMANNLKQGLEVLRGMLDDGKATATDIWVFPLDRAEGKVYKRSFTKNIVPTLTTANKYLFVVSMDLISDFWIHPSLFCTYSTFLMFSISHTKFLNENDTPKT